MTAPTIVGENVRARAAYGSNAPAAIKRLRREEQRCVECGVDVQRATRGCCACGARGRYRRKHGLPTIYLLRSEKRRRRGSTSRP